MLVLKRQEVETLLDLDLLVTALAQVMADLSAGQVSMPQRIAASVAERGGLLGAMPVYVSSLQTLSVKVVNVFPRNAASDLPTHQAVVLVFNSINGSPLALMDGTYLTAARTAAGSALATRLLARADADVLTIVGTGVQAKAHVRAIPRVRPIREIRILGRDPRKAKTLVEQASSELRIPARAVDTFRDAAAGAGVICATTDTAAPVILGRWLDPGVHINSVGFNPNGRELDDASISRARLFVESRQAALAPLPSGTNDLILPLRDGVIAEEQIAEVGEVVSGKREGRTAPEQVTIYKSVGVAVQDAAAARLVLEAARRRGRGVEVEV